MTTILTRPLDATARPGKVTLLRVLRSEWIKLRTVRSTSVTLLIAVAAMVGLGMLFHFGMNLFEFLQRRIAT